jgi:hypothetical protein
VRRASSTPLPASSPHCAPSPLANLKGCNTGVVQMIIDGNFLVLLSSPSGGSHNSKMTTQRLFRLSVINWISLYQSQLSDIMIDRRASYQSRAGAAKLGLPQSKGDLLARKLRLLHRQNPPLQSASVLPEISYYEWTHFPGQGQAFQVQKRIAGLIRDRGAQAATPSSLIQWCIRTAFVDWRAKR